MRIPASQDVVGGVLPIFGSPGVASDEFFEFHVQQAVEKPLKAWLALQCVMFPLTRDLAVFLATLEFQSGPQTDIEGLIEFAPFASHCRYEALESDAEPSDRVATVRKLEALQRKVRAVRESTK